MAPLFQGQSNSQRKQTGEINLGYRYIRQTILDQALIPPLFREEILDQTVIKDSLCDEGSVYSAYNPSFSACFFSGNSIFLSQQISQQCFSTGLSAQPNGAEVGSQMIRVRRTAELAGVTAELAGERNSRRKKTQNFILHAKYYTSILTAITTDQSF
jgi:hypothetical protein